MIPSIGIRYTNISFQEGKKISGKASHKSHDVKSMDGILGLKISKEITSNSGMIIVPEIYGSLSKDFHDKDGKAKEIIIQGTNEIFRIESSKEEPVAKNFGLGLTIKSNRVEIGGNFDAVFIDKYQGFTGSFKLKINL